MIEVEVKFKAFDGIEEKLKSAGFELVGEKLEEDVYFNSPVRDFRQTDEALRVRREYGETENARLTYKGKKLDSITKTREEITVDVSDSEAMKLILQKLGFKAVATVRKRRKIYRLGDVIACVDEVDNLGKFVELEIDVEDAMDAGRETGLEKAREKIAELAKSLGLGSLEESITSSYLEMLLEELE